MKSKERPHKNNIYRNVPLCVLHYAILVNILRSYLKGYKLALDIKLLNFQILCLQTLLFILKYQVDSKHLFSGEYVHVV